MAFNLKKMFISDEADEFENNVGSEDEFYTMTKSDALVDGSTKMILLEPRAFSEAQQIADQLKTRNTVVVNLKRVTPEHARRIVDFLSGTVYAIGGDLQKIGGGIFLCTPKNMNVQGKITTEDSESETDIELEA